mgnify:CR=1 FL=1
MLSRGVHMKKKTIMFLTIVLVIILAIIIGILKHNANLKNKTKKDNNKRYLEIKKSAKKAVEWNINAMYPNCPITDTFNEEKNANTSGSHYNASFLINNGYIKKDELLDIDKKNYCDVYVIIQTSYENPQDHQNNCSTAYKIYLKCNEYKDKGYINWVNK